MSCATPFPDADLQARVCSATVGRGANGLSCPGRGRFATRRLRKEWRSHAVNTAHHQHLPI